MSSKFFKQTAVLFAGVGLASAISISSRASGIFGNSNISSSCQSTLVAIAGNSEASSCLNVPGLFALVTLSANASAINPLNTWLQGLCAADVCSNDTITSITSNITTGCSSDLSSVGITSNGIQEVVQAIPQFYSTVRKIGCLKTSSNNTLCVSSTLLDIQTTLGHNLTFGNAFSSFTEIFTDIKNSNLPPSVTCTGCIQEAFSIFQQDDPTLISDNSTVQSAVASQCGANFLTGTVTSDVTEGTGSAAPTGSLASSNTGNTNGAFVSVTPSMSIACSFLLVVAAGTFMSFA